jgi:hypothetical protein
MADNGLTEIRGISGVIEMAKGAALREPRQPGQLALFAGGRRSPVQAAPRPAMAIPSKPTGWRVRSAFDRAITAISSIKRKAAARTFSF